MGCKFMNIDRILAWNETCMHELLTLEFKSHEFSEFLDQKWSHFLIKFLILSSSV